MLFCWLLFSRPNLFCSTIYSLRLFVLEMPYHKKRKTDRPPRKLIPEDLMKAACAAVLDGKPVNAVARECSVTHMTLEHFLNLHTMTSGNQSYFRHQLSTSFCHNSNFHRWWRENAVRLSFMCDKASLRLILETTRPIPKNMLKLILTDYITVTNRGSIVETGHQPFRVMLS